MMDGWNVYAGTPLEESVVRIDEDSKTIVGDRELAIGRAFFGWAIYDVTDGKSDVLRSAEFDYDNTVEASVRAAFKKATT